MAPNEACALVSEVGAVEVGLVEVGSSSSREQQQQQQ